MNKETYGRYRDCPELDEYTATILRELDHMGGAGMISVVADRGGWERTPSCSHHIEKEPENGGPLDESAYIEIEHVSYRGREERKLTLTEEGEQALKIYRERSGDDPLGMDEAMSISKGEWRDLQDRLEGIEENTTELEQYVFEWTGAAESYLLAIRRIVEGKLSVDFQSYLGEADGDSL